MTEGCIIENMSGRKLTYVVSGLLVMQILCFLLGAIVSPTPNSSMQVDKRKKKYYYQMNVTYYGSSKRMT